MAFYGSLRRTCARFDSFQVDLSSGELLRSGIRVPIQDQPFQILRLLLQADGRVVTREQVRAALWPENTFVDFEHGVNTAVKKLRQALEDSAESPRFVETLPKIGYRFLVPMEWVADTTSRNSPPSIVPITSLKPTLVPPPPATKETPRLARWRFVSVAVGLLLLAIGGAYVLRSRTQVQTDKLTIVPFTTFPGFEIAPSFSPDGNQIVFSWFGYEKEFRFDLFVKQVGQERVVQLTHHPAIFLVPAWSPDGRFIAFMRQADPDATGIFVVSALGGSERKLADITPYGSWNPIAVSWSPDGKWLAFPKLSSSANQADSSPEHFRIHRVNVETSEEQTVPDPSPDCGNVFQPAFSPDGKYLASVCVLTEGVAKIYVQTPGGKQPREVTDARSPEGFSGVAWAKDSQSILYSSDHQLWRVPLAGGKSEKLLFAQDVESVAVARTGNRLAYSQVRHPSGIWQLDLATEAKPAGPPTKLISSSRGDSIARVSPDGKHIAFQSGRSGSEEIWVCDRDASNPVQLTSFGGSQIGSPSWSPDSRSIAFDLRASGKAELYIVKINGGPATRLSTGTPNASSPYWSADGRSVYFSTEPPESIWRVPVEGGTAVRLMKAGPARGAPQESVDGTRIFFERAEGDHGRVWSALVNGGDERPVAGMPTDVSWAAAPTGVYFIDGSPRHFSLNYCDSATQQVRKVADLPGLFVIWGSHVAPDGRAFLFSGIEHSEGDIVLVEGFQ